ncbi:hypothetical protein C0J52_05957 [Blattella germanica]|nr:hypothetical protein C0J52_05957 [Blattella germanica]
MSIEDPYSQKEEGGTSNSSNSSPTASQTISHISETDLKRDDLTEPSSAETQSPESGKDSAEMFRKEDETPGVQMSATVSNPESVLSNRKVCQYYWLLVVDEEGSGGRGRTNSSGLASSHNVKELPERGESLKTPCVWSRFSHQNEVHPRPSGDYPRCCGLGLGKSTMTKVVYTLAFLKTFESLTFYNREPKLRRMLWITKALKYCTLKSSKNDVRPILKDYFHNKRSINSSLLF